MCCPIVWRLAGSSAAELRARGCAACSARTFAFDGTQRGLEQELWLTRLLHDVCATNPARPAPTRSSSMRSDAISRPYGDFTPAAVWVEGHHRPNRFALEPRSQSGFGHYQAQEVRTLAGSRAELSFNSEKCTTLVYFTASTPLF